MMIWTDIETTGLNYQHCDILEIAFVVTDNDLNVLGHHTELIPPYSRDTLFDPNSSEVAFETAAVAMHEKSGLIKELQTKFSWQDTYYEVYRDRFHTELSRADKAMRTFLASVSEGRKVPLCGSSVHFDRRFLERDFPELMDEFFTHRNIDVSSFKEYFKLLPGYKESSTSRVSTHRALPDCFDSIATMRELSEHIKFN